MVITGRPDFDAPDWRNNIPGHPMTDQEITDVVAWLASQRPNRACRHATPSAAATRLPEVLIERTACKWQTSSSTGELSRRALFTKIGLLLNGLAVMVLATPVMGYLLAPILGAERGQYQHWITSATSTSFPRARPGWPSFANPISNAWDGDTDKIPCWVRRLTGRAVPGVRD